MTRVALRAGVIAFAVPIASGVNVLCPAGTRVYSLTVWSGGWLDGMYMRCTGGGEQKAIPSEFDEDPGGDNHDDICAGTGGLRSMKWDIPSASDHPVMVYGNITCLNDKPVFFADRWVHDMCYDKGADQGLAKPILTGRPPCLGSYTNRL